MAITVRLPGDLLRVSAKCGFRVRLDLPRSCDYSAESR
jgi:hypothetical protein